MKNERNAGRPQLPPERKKERSDVFLIPAEKEVLIERFGSLSLACRAHLINEPTDNQALETVKQINSLTAKLLNR